MAVTYSKSGVVLLDNEAATSPFKRVPRGGRYAFVVTGTFNGATVALQMLGPDGVTPITLADGSFTADGAAAVDVPVNAQFRALVTGGPPSGMYAALYGVFR